MDIQNKYSTDHSYCKVQKLLKLNHNKLKQLNCVKSDIVSGYCSYFEHLFKVYIYTHPCKEIVRLTLFGNS